MTDSLLEKASESIKSKNFAEFATLFEAYDKSAIVSETDEKGKIIFVNKLFEEVSGYTRNELLGQDHRIINSGYHPKEFFRDMWKTIRSGKMWRGEICNRAKDGSLYWVDSFIHPLFGVDGKICGFLSLRYLITEKKRIETLKDQYLKQLKQRNEDLENFARVISHNFRSAVSNILGLVQIFEEKEKLSLENQKYLAYIEESAKNLDQMLREIAEVIYIKGQFHEIPYEEVVFTEILTEAKKLIRENIEITLKIRGDGKLITLPAYLKSILYNLLSNSVKYQQKDKEPKVEIEFFKDKQNITIYFSDNGCGIEEKHYEKIFQLYGRVHTEKEGRGLGLYLVKSQVEALGGTVSVKSKVNEGTTFTIILPVTPPPPPINW